MIAMPAAGRKRSIPVCVAVVAGSQSEVEPDQCRFLARPETVRRRCNSHCRLEWREAGRGECSAHCGPGQRTVSRVCVRLTQDSKVVTVPHSYCQRELSSNPPPTTVPCEGECKGLQWQYGAWSACSKTCGPGTMTRSATCYDQLTGSSLEVGKCRGKAPAVTRRECEQGDCPRWGAAEWSACSASCGRGLARREVWCERGGQRLDTGDCDQEVEPPHSKECEAASQCGQWEAGEWSDCSSECGPGTRTRQLLCLDNSGRTLDRSHCSPHSRPVNSSTCVVISCQETNEVHSEEDMEDTGEVVVTKSSGHRKKSQRRRSRYHHQLPRYRWKIGRWTDCSEACGGQRSRVVACYDRVRGRLETDHGKCGAVRRRPRDTEHCGASCPGQSGVWRTGQWSGCSASCGTGVRWRRVQCLQPHCDHQTQPAEEEDCVVAAVCQTPLLQVKAALVESERKLSSWRTGEWSPCSSTCGGGVRSRLVQCYDGHQVNTDLSSCLQESAKPYSEDSCNLEPCPVWNYGQWSECDQACGGGRSQRLVRCQDHLGQTLPDQQCSKSRPPDSKDCNKAACSLARRRSHLWRVGQWGQVRLSRPPAVSY